MTQTPRRIYHELSVHRNGVPAEHKPPRTHTPPNDTGQQNAHRNPLHMLFLHLEECHIRQIMGLFGLIRLVPHAVESFRSVPPLGMMC